MVPGVCSRWRYYVEPLPSSTEYHSRDPRFWKQKLQPLGKSDFPLRNMLLDSDGCWKSNRGTPGKPELHATKWPQTQTFSEVPITQAAQTLQAHKKCLSRYSPPIRTFLLFYGPYPTPYPGLPENSPVQLLKVKKKNWSVCTMWRKNRCTVVRIWNRVYSCVIIYYHIVSTQTTVNLLFPHPVCGFAHSSQCQSEVGCWRLTLRNLPSQYNLGFLSLSILPWSRYELRSGYIASGYLFGHTIRK